MILNVHINESVVALKVPDDMLKSAEEIFQRMDADMARGWQMSRTWVERPDLNQRCQIVADRLLTAMSNHNQELATLMAAYILVHLPNVRDITIDTSGDMTQTVFDHDDHA